MSNPEPVYRPLKVRDGEQWVNVGDPRVTTLLSLVEGGEGERSIADTVYDPDTGTLTVVFSDETTAGPFAVRGADGQDGTDGADGQHGVRGTRVTMLATPPTEDILPGDINIDPATGVPHVYEP